MDRDEARALAIEDPTTCLALLREAGRLTPDGLDELLDMARSWMRDDPAIGERLAEIVRRSAGEAAAPAAAPRATYVLAQARAIAGDMTASIELIDEARVGFDALGLHGEALRTNLGRSQALNEMGRHDEALAACAEILEHLAPLDVNDAAAVGLAAAAHQNSGLCMELSGRFEGALDHYLSARIGYESLGDARAIAEVSYDRALVLLHLGQHAEALHALDRAASSFRLGGFRALQVMALSNMAEVLLQRGEFQACLDALGEASTALEDISWPGGEQVRLLVAGRAQLALNLLPEAVASFNGALDILTGTELYIDLARAQWGHGLALARLGRTEPAVTSLASAADQFRRSGQRTWLAQSLVDQARVLEQRGAVDAARSVADAAVDAAVPDTPAAFEAQLMSLQLEGGGVADRVGAVRAAVAWLELPPLAAGAAHAHGRALLGAGRVVEAVGALRASVDTIEQLRGGLTHDLLLARFLDDKQSPYADLLTALVEADVPAAESLAVAEQAKSRTLADIVSGLVRHDADTSDALDADLHAAYSELFSGESANDAARHERLRLRVHDLERRRQASRLDLPARRVVAPLGPVASLDAGVPLVSYAIAGEQIHIFVVVDGVVHRRNALMSASRLAVDVDRLRRHWDRFRLGHSLVERHMTQLESTVRQMLHDLHAALVAPVESLLGESNEVVVIPDGVLHEVPFAALWDGDDWWSARREVRYAPSIETLRHLPPPRDGATLVVGVADALAPMVDAEVDAVAATAGRARVLRGPEASRHTVVTGLSDAARVHLAGHAMFRPDNPMYSALRLHDSWLTAADVLDLDLNGAVVVLSACDTARTQHRRSAEINGFVRGFLGAGASAVVASQWTADDAATTALMSAYYQCDSSLRPAAALRRAQQQVRARWPHPYYWAPWVVVGR